MNTESNVHESTVNWVGIDIAKKTFQAAPALAGQRWSASALRELPTKRFARTADGLHAFVIWLNEVTPASVATTSFRAVMENTGRYSTELFTLMEEHYPHFQPAIIHAVQTHAYIKSMNLRSKTDVAEARALAIYGLERRPIPYVPLSDEQVGLRELVRHRAFLVDQQLALSNRQGENSPNTFVQQSEHRMDGAFTREIQKTEAQIRKLMLKHPALHDDVNLLTTIHGVGFLTATTILAELGDLRRFTRARQLAAYVGLSPRHVQSGTSINKPAHLCKMGNSRVRKALYLAALTAIKDNGHMQATYERLCAEGKPKMVALGAVMRKLLVLMRALLISQQPYNRQWKNPRQRSVKAAAA